MFEDYDKYFEDIVKYKIVTFLTFAKEKKKIGATVRAANLLPCIYNVWLFIIYLNIVRSKARGYPLHGVPLGFVAQKRVCNPYY